MAMNPERERMLKENADKEFEPLNPLPVKCIRITGANVLALQDPSAGQTQSDSPKVNKTVAKVSRKRSYDSFEQQSVVDSAYDQRLKRRLPPQLPPPPPSNNHTAYLASVLRNWTLKLTLEPTATKKAAPVAATHLRQTTSVGLLVTEQIRRLNAIPVLRLPTLEQVEKLHSMSPGPLERVAHGSLLEDV